MEREFSAPLGESTRGRLVIVSGATHLTLRADAALPTLYRARFERLVPDVWADGGTVMVKYRHIPWLDWLLDLRNGWSTPRAEIVLNGAIPWEIDIRGGASWFEADLRGLRLDAFSLRGGVSKAEVQLPRPTGAVPIRLIGGVSDFRLHRPLGAAARTRVRGGISSFQFDAQHFGGIGGDSRWETPDSATASDRFDIAVTGGVSTMTIDAR
jgi:hypothetical protein